MLLALQEPGLNDTCIQLRKFFATIGSECEEGNMRNFTRLILVFTCLLFTIAPAISSPRNQTSLSIEDGLDRLESGIKMAESGPGATATILQQWKMSAMKLRKSIENLGAEGRKLYESRIDRAEIAIERLSKSATPSTQEHQASVPLTPWRYADDAKPENLKPFSFVPDWLQNEPVKDRSIHEKLRLLKNQLQLETGLPSNRSFDSIQGQLLSLRKEIRNLPLNEQSQFDPDLRDLHEKLLRVQSVSRLQDKQSLSEAQQERTKQKEAIKELSNPLPFADRVASEASQTPAEKQRLMIQQHDKQRDALASQGQQQTSDKESRIKIRGDGAEFGVPSRMHESGRTRNRSSEHPAGKMLPVKQHDLPGSDLAAFDVHSLIAEYPQIPFQDKLRAQRRLLDDAARATLTSNPALSKAGDIRGKVTSRKNGLPLPRISIDAFDAKGSWAGTALTNAKGEYSFSNSGFPLHRGAYYLYVSDPNSSYQRMLFPAKPCNGICNVTDARPLEVRGEHPRTGINFTLEDWKGGVISGTVTDPTTGVAVDQSSIEVYNSQGELAGIALLSNDGSYSVPVNPGRYYLRTRGVDSNYADQLYKNGACDSGCVVTRGVPVQVSNGERKAGIDFSPAISLGNGSISGTVFAQDTGLWIPYSIVHVYDSTGAYVAYSWVNRDGTYSVSLPPGGPYYAVARDWIHQDWYEGEIYNGVPCPVGCDVTAGTGIMVAADNDSPNITFTLTPLIPLGEISGVVTDAQTSSPLDSTSIYLYDSSGYVMNDYSDASGHYSFHVPEGTYYALGMHGGYFTQLYDGILCNGCNPPDGTPIVVTAGTPQTAINFALSAPPPPGDVTGQVSREDNGAPISVAVEAYDSSGIYTGYYTYSDASGNYSFSDYGYPLPAGTYYIRTHDYDGIYADEVYNNVACPPGCNVLTGSPVVVTSGGTTANINFSLGMNPGPGDITGSVQDAQTGNPIPWLEVDAYNSSGFFTGSYTYTDSSGNYSFSDYGYPLDPNTYYVKTRDWNGQYVDEVYNNVPCSPGCNVLTGTPVIVTSRTATNNIDFALDHMPDPGDITGQVTSASTGDPIPWLEIDAYNSSGAYTGYYTYSDSSGNYSFSDYGYPLQPGTYYVKTRDWTQEYVDEVYDNVPCPPGCNVRNGTGVVVLSGQITSNINFTLGKPGSISGHVEDSSTGLPLTNIEVDLHNSSGGFVGYDYTDSSGNYLISGLAPGNYFARTAMDGGPPPYYVNELYNNIDCQPYWSCNPTSGTPIAVQTDTNTGNINFSLGLAGSLSGNITDSSTGLPLEFVYVNVYDASGNYLTYGYTDASGDYVVPALAPGTVYAVTDTSNVPSYMSEAYDNILCFNCDPTTATPITIQSGSNTTNIDFALATGGSISGRVTDTDGVGIDNVRVSIYGSDGVRLFYTWTDATGYYQTPATLQTGTYHAEANADYYIDELYDDIQCQPTYTCNVTSSTPISVVIGSNTPNIDFSLATGGSITGTVTAEATGLPIENVEVDIFNATGNLVSYGYTDNYGNYEAVDLMTGSHYAITNSRGASGNYVDELYNNITCMSSICYRLSGTPISVTAESVTSGINFALATGGSISGHVTDAQTGNPINTLYISIYDVNDQEAGYGYPDNSGNYTVTGLSPGTYHAVAYPSGNSSYLRELYDNIPCAFGCDRAGGDPIAVSAGNDTPNINFGLTRGGTINGRVTTSGDAPLASVRVRLYDSNGNYVYRSQFTNGSGYYTLAGLPPGSYYVATASDGYVDEVYNNVVCFPNSSCDRTAGNLVTVNSGGTTFNINFVLDVAGSISGYVTDANSGDPLNDVEVDVYDSNGDSAGWGWSDSSGYFSVRSLTSGNFYARTFVPNGSEYVDELYNDIVCSDCDVTTGTPIAVTLGSDTGNTNFGLQTGGAIEGTVTDVDTGLPISGLRVRLYDSQNNYLKSASTNASGQYRIGGLDTGSYYIATNSLLYINELYDGVNCEPSGFCDHTNGTLVAVTIGTTTTSIDFSLNLGGTVSGTVTGQLSGEPISDVEIDLYDSEGNYAGYGYSDSSGNYDVPGLQSGVYKARTYIYNNQPYVNEVYENILCVSSQCDIDSGTDINVSSGATTPNINFELAVGGSVSGRITDQTTGDPLASIRIEVYDSAGFYAGSVQTNASGNYSLGMLPGGSYFAVARPTGNNSSYVREIYDNIPCLFCEPTTGTPIPVTLGANTPNINFELGLGGSISGTITDAVIGDGIDSVEIDVYAPDGSFINSGYTDATGSYSIGGLLTGSYYAVAVPGMNTQYTNEIYSNLPCIDCEPEIGEAIAVTLGAGTANINFALKIGGSISGHITDGGTGNPIADAEMVVYDSRGRYLRYAYSDSSGNYEVRGLPTGTYYVTASVPNSDYIPLVYSNQICLYCDATNGNPIDVPLGTNIPNVNFAFTIGGSISGRVTDSGTGLGISNADVLVYNDSGEYVSAVLADSSGNYIAGGLPTGNYYVSVSASEYVGELYNDVTCEPYWNCNINLGSIIAVVTGSSTPNIHFALDRGGSITGTITDSVSGNGIKDIHVMVYNSAGNYVKGDYSDAAGHYSVTGLAGVGYYVYANALYSTTNHISELYDNITCLWCDVTQGTEVSVTRGAETPNINFALDSGGIITGTVRDASTNAPLQDVSLDVDNATGDFVTGGSTNIAGTYTVRGLASGTYYVRTRRAGYVGQVYNGILCVGCDPTIGTPVVVTAGSTTSGVDFLLDSCPAISLSPVSLPGGRVGSSYSQTITASGGIGPYDFYSDALPAGLTLGSSTGEITGTPTALGLRAVEIYASDQNGCTGSRKYGLNISFAMPSEVSGPGSLQPLRFQSKTTFTWEDGSTNRSSTFDVYRATSADLHSGHYGSCQQSSVPNNSSQDSSEPPAGSVWFYLVTGRNAVGEEGTMGNDSQGIERGNFNPCP